MLRLYSPSEAGRAAQVMAVVLALVALVTVLAMLADSIPWTPGLIVVAICLGGLVLGALHLPDPLAKAVEEIVEDEDDADDGQPWIILDNLPDPIILLNRQREVALANRAARDLFSPTMEGRDLAQSIRHPRVLEGADSVLEGGEERSVEISLPGQVSHTYAVHLAPIGGPASPGVPSTSDGSTVRAVVAIYDLTMVKKAEEMRADFVANVSHELRSPMAAVIGFIETLKGPARDDPAARDRFLDIMAREAARMTRLIDDLLSLSRVQVNEHVPPDQVVDLSGLLTAVAETNSPSAEAREMTIVLADMPQAVRVLGDRDQLVQVFQNLVDNAIKYGREGTRVDIALSVIPAAGRGQPLVSVAVRDQGEGIPSEQIPRLTERFYRIDKARSRSMGGTGLGLAIVKHILARHRGRMTVESRVGEGSTFTVILPLAKDESAENEESGPDSGHGRAGRRPHRRSS